MVVPMAEPAQHARTIMVLHSVRFGRTLPARFEAQTEAEEAEEKDTQNESKTKGEWRDLISLEVIKSSDLEWF